MSKTRRAWAIASPASLSSAGSHTTRSAPRSATTQTRGSGRRWRQRHVRFSSAPRQYSSRGSKLLAALGSRGLRLALLTKGDRALQKRRVAQSGLASYFDVIEIVDQKTPEAIAAVVDRLGVPRTATLSVGNSVRSDVLPSLAAGVQPVWIDAHVWEYERDHESLGNGVLKLDDLSRLFEVAVP